MNRRNKSLLATAITTTMLLIMLLMPMTASAASVGISVSKSSVAVGETFTATCTFSGGSTYLAGVTAFVSFDPSVVQYTGASGDGQANASGSGVNVVLETSATNRTSLSLTLSFKAKKAGSSSMSISYSDVVDWDGITLTTAGASNSVTVTGGGGGGGGGGTEKPTSTNTPGNTTEKPSESETPTETIDPEKMIDVSVDNQEKSIWTDLSEIELPEGFERTEIEYDGKTIQGAKNENGLVLLYLTDKDGENGAFYIYDADAGALYPYVNLSLMAMQYIILEPGESVEIPEGYTSALKSIGENDVKAYEIQGAADEFFLVYAMNGEGEVGFYSYDVKESTLQRYNPEAVPQPKEEPLETTLADPVTPEEKGLFDRLLDDDGILAVTAVLAGLIVVLLVVILTMVISRNKKNKLMQTASSMGVELYEDEANSDELDLHKWDGDADQ